MYKRIIHIFKTLGGVLFVAEMRSMAPRIALPDVHGSFAQFLGLAALATCLVNAFALYRTSSCL